MGADEGPDGFGDTGSKGCDVAQCEEEDNARSGRGDTPVRQGPGVQAACSHYRHGGRFRRERGIRSHDPYSIQGDEEILAVSCAHGTEKGAAEDSGLGGVHKFPFQGLSRRVLCVSTTGIEDYVVEEHGKISCEVCSSSGDSEFQVIRIRWKERDILVSGSREQEALQDDDGL